MASPRNKQHRATTLIEILIYFSVLSVFLLAAVTFSLQILNVRTLSSNIHDIKDDLSSIQSQLSYAIQTATSVDEAQSVFDQNPSTLQLVMPSVGEDPTIFTLSSGVIMMQQGSGDPIPLNSAASQVTNFTVHRTQQGNIPDLLSITVEAHPLNADVNQLDTTRTIELTVSLRHKS